MSNYALSVSAKGQAVVTAKYQAPELRRKVPTVFEMALKNQQISIPNAPDLRKSELRPVEIYYQTDVAPGSATAKTALHTGNYGDSGKIELTYVTHVETFSIPRKIAQNNMLQYQEIWNTQYAMKWANLRKRHDDSALAFVYNNRLQRAKSVIDPQIASANPGFWNETNYALEIDAGKASRFVQKAKSFMAARLYTGTTYDVIADLQVADEFEYASQQGSGNQTNLAWQFANCNISKTQDQITSNYGNGCMLIMPTGMLAGMYWNDPLNVRGVMAGENEVGMLGTKADPYGSGAVADVSMYTKRADTSANTSGGSTQDIMDHWELTLTVAYAVPPLKTTGESVVALIGQANS